MNSVREQGFSDLEHVIQDGASTDGTLELIHQLANSTTSIISEPDTGIYDAINRGIRRASGGVIGLMHSDDIFASDDVLTKVAAAFKDPKIDGVYGDLQYVAADDLSRVIRHWRAGEYHPRLIKRGWMPPHPTLYLRREVFDRFGLYDPSFRISADYDAMLRYLVKGKIELAYIPEVLVKMRVGGESNSSVGRIIRKSWEDLRAMKNNGVGGVSTLLWKNLSKVGQFVVRD